jgi:hypothetical protein
MLTAMGARWLAGGCLMATASAESMAPPRTFITPHMEVPVEPGQNIIYCSTFQIAWNDMKTDIVGEDIRLEDAPETVARLNQSLSSEADIDGRDYLARVGVGSDAFVEGINRDLRAKFGRDAPQIDDTYRSGEIILAYALLQKSMQFEHPFERFDNAVSFWEGERRATVYGFGINRYSEAQYGALRGQVEIIDYHDSGDFVIRLRSTRPDDEIVLANVTPENTLLETYRAVNARVERSTPDRLANNDVLMIPLIDLAVHHSYDSLLDLNLLNEGFEEYFVRDAIQDIRFRMDETGVAVKSEAKFAIEKKGPMHRLLVFDDPYMLYLKTKDGDYPYFMIWVDNANLMIPSGYARARE